MGIFKSLFGRNAPIEKEYSAELIIKAVEEALAHKGAAWLTIQLGMDLREAQLDNDIPEPRIHGIALSDFLDRTVLGSSTEEMAERFADYVFIGYLADRAAEGGIPAPSEAVEFYLARTKDKK